jgi:molybdopterin synthase sulfur carrier subunit
LKVLYFAWVRQKVGMAEEDIAPRSPGHAAAFADPRQLRAAVNQDFATPDAPVGPGDEVAFFPPVTGG